MWVADLIGGDEVEQGRGTLHRAGRKLPDVRLSIGALSMRAANARRPLLDTCQSTAVYMVVVGEMTAGQLGSVPNYGRVHRTVGWAMTVGSNVGSAHPHHGDRAGRPDAAGRPHGLQGCGRGDRGCVRGGGVRGGERGLHRVRGRSAGVGRWCVCVCVQGVG